MIIYVNPDAFFSQMNHRISGGLRPARQPGGPGGRSPPGGGLGAEPPASIYHHLPPTGVWGRSPQQALNRISGALFGIIFFYIFYVLLFLIKIGRANITQIKRQVYYILFDFLNPIYQVPIHATLHSHSFRDCDKNDTLILGCTREILIRGL